ncbi:MAG: hypothetical protein GX455_00835 [Phycisphaerae bacterium]|nr:hypothetical protein [Phycisphaerae bacterium]
MYIPPWKMLVSSLVGVPFYWDYLHTPYRDIRTARYPILTSLICGTLYVLPIYLRNAAAQSRSKEIGLFEHAFPLLYTLAIGFIILFSANGLMIVFYHWLFMADKGTSDDRQIRALRAFHGAAFYQILLFAGFFCAGHMDYSHGIVILIFVSCLKLVAVYAALRAEVKYGREATGPEPVDIDWVCKLGALCSLDVALLWLTI